MIEIGEIYESNNYGKFKIIGYKDADNILVKFIDTNFEIYAQSSSIYKGSVRDLKSNRLKLKQKILNIGYEGIGVYSYLKDIKAKMFFNNMLVRSYNKNYKKSYSTYENVTVCEYWHNFQNFCEWFYDNYTEGYELDKDLYIEGNQEYGPLTCTFVSPEINSLFSNKSKDSDLPKGVSKKNYGFYSRCNINGKRKCGKLRKKVEEARIDYLKMKSDYVLNDIMTRKDFPERLLFSFWLKVNKMKETINILREKT